MIARIVVVVLAVLGLVLLGRDLGVARDIEHGVALGERGQAAQAERVLLDAAARTDDTTPLLRAAQLRLFQRQPERALGPAREAVAREPENAQAWLLVAQAAERSGDASQAASARREVAALVARP